MNKWPDYVGTLDQDKMTGHVKSAYTAWANQRRRCYIKTNPRYKDNGAKGITVEYSSRDFVGWYLFNIKKFTGKNPSVGRLDHSKSYTFENIRIESLEDNSMERIQRVGTTRPRRSVIITDYDSGEHLMIAASHKEAESLTGVFSTHVARYCSGKIKRSKDGYGFKNHK